jgi:hypothetical protein
MLPIRKIVFTTVITAAIPMATPAVAYDLPVPAAKVTLVEITYQPNEVYFYVDQPVANCPANSLLQWNGGAQYPPGNPATEADRKANVKQISNTLIVAMHTKGLLRVHARNKTATVVNCVVEFLHALPAP